MPEVGNMRTTENQASQWNMSRGVSGNGNASLSMEDFYKLLAAEMKYQDADNPMDTSEMMAQMVQTQMIASINQMNQISMITYASSMIGQNVTLGLIDPATGMSTGETKTGMVEGATIFGDSPMIIVDGKRYLLSQVVIVGEGELEAEPPDDDKNAGAGGSAGSDAPGGAGGSAGSDAPGGAGGSTDPEAPGGAGGGTDPEAPGGAGGSTDPEAPGGAGGSTNPDDTGGTDGSGDAGGNAGAAQTELQRMAAAMNTYADRQRTGMVTAPVWDKW